MLQTTHPKTVSGSVRSDGPDCYLSYDVILLENESRLLLLVLLNLLHRSTDISIHLQAIHNLTEVLLLHWQLARGPLLVCDT